LKPCRFYRKIFFTQKKITAKKFSPQKIYRKKNSPQKIYLKKIAPHNFSLHGKYSSVKSRIFIKIFEIQAQLRRYLSTRYTFFLNLSKTKIFLYQKIYFVSMMKFSVKNNAKKFFVVKNYAEYFLAVTLPAVKSFAVKLT
jgi:hypothetical protein